MGAKALKYAFFAIAIYLGVENYKGSIGLVDSGSQGGVGLIKAFQGR